MHKFLIKNKIYNDKTVAFLYYDEKSRRYRIEIPENVKSTEAPLIIADFIERGQREIGNEWSYRWVKQRVVPADRQNIGQILKRNGLQFYDEFPMLISNQGRSCQDECYLVEV